MTRIEHSIVVAVHRLDEAVIRHVAVACDRLRMRYVPWSGEVLPALSAAPMLLVAGLRNGDRRVPADLMDLCTKAYPGTPLLLLCQEPLASPTVSLHDGQIVLVGPPLSAARVHARMMILTADRRSPSGDSQVSWVDDDSEHVWVRERLHPDIWSAGIACRGLGHVAWIRPYLHNTIQGLTAVAPTPSVTDAANQDYEPLVQMLRQPASPIRRLEAVAASGCRAGVIHFDRQAEQWLVYWPRPEAPLWLLSERRMPPFWDLGAALARTGMAVMRAYPGDLMIGLSGRPPEDEEDEGLELLGERGGTSLLAELERRLSATPRALAGSFVEVRG